MICKYCHDTGQITLFTSTVSCDECKPDATAVLGYIDTTLGVLVGDNIYINDDGQATLAIGHDGSHAFFGYAMHRPDRDGHIEVREASGSVVRVAFKPSDAHLNIHHFLPYKGCDLSSPSSPYKKYHSSRMEQAFPTNSFPEGNCYIFNDGSMLYHVPNGHVYQGLRYYWLINHSGTIGRDRNFTPIGVGE